ncbi:mitochondrial amidoxime reducing component 2-like isoform X2 [Uloborus diversus]|nr:mitochondrial amidoxime reducing component 2-like isoform X2 [Uloborus diversus]
MLMWKDNVLLSQRDAPTLQLLTQRIEGDYLLISGPEVETLRIPIKKALSPNDKVVECRVHTDMVQAVDRGDEIASWFESYLKISGVRFLQYLPNLENRKYVRNDPFYAKMRKKQAISFQDLAALHILSVSSLEDLNSRIEGKKMTLHNFRPVVVVEGSKPYEEDAWEYIKFEGGAEAELLVPTTRCLLTTNDPETAILSQKEPLITLRRYRIPKDPEIVKKTGSLPCFGTHCAVIKPGEIKVGDEIYAVVGRQPAMIQKM